MCIYVYVGNACLVFLYLCIHVCVSLCACSFVCLSGLWGMYMCVCLCMHLCVYGNCACVMLYVEDVTVSCI